MVLTGAHSKEIMIYGKLQKVPLTVTAEYGWPLKEFTWKFKLVNNTEDDGISATISSAAILPTAKTVQTEKFTSATMDMPEMTNEEAIKGEIEKKRIDEIDQTNLSVEINDKFTEPENLAVETQKTETLTVTDVKEELAENESENYIDYTEVVTR